MTKLEGLAVAMSGAPFATAASLRKARVVISHLLGDADLENNDVDRTVLTRFLESYLDAKPTP